jgi:sugar lactone lactonase YvrE
VEYRHYKPQAGESAPAHHYPLLLLLAGAGAMVGIAGTVLGAPIALIGTAVAIGAVAAFVLVPSPIKAQGWSPPAAPAAVGLLGAPQDLGTGELLAVGQVQGPEDLAISADGASLYASSFGDGRVVRIDLNAAGDHRVQEHARTGGSPVDLLLRSDGSLLLCDWSCGLLEIAPDGEVKTLLELGTPIDGRPFVRPDGVSQSADGTIYISEGSARPGIWNGVFEALEAGLYGRVVALDPGTGKARTVLDGLSFANGNAIEPAGSYLLVADQYRYRIARLWIAGPQAGRCDTFAANLPGLPHNIHYDSDGLLWVGLYQGRSSTLDRISPRPRLKSLLAKLPASAIAGPERVKEGHPGRGAVIALDAHGHPVHYLAGPPARIDTISGVVRHGNDLYIGTLTGDAILRVPLDPAA